MLSHFSRVQLFAALWTVACRAPLFMVFSRQEYWSRLPFTSPGDLLDPGIEPESYIYLHWQAGPLPLAPPEVQPPAPLQGWGNFNVWRVGGCPRAGMRGGVERYPPLSSI